MAIKGKKLQNGKFVVYDEENENDEWVEGDAVSIEQ